MAVEFKRSADGRLWMIEPNVGRTEYCVDVCIGNGFDLPWLGRRRGWLVLTHDNPDPDALAATAVYMLGCGATLFATERELETFDFQRSLPVDAWRVFTAKTGWALASGCALAAVLWSATFVLFLS